MLPNVRIASTDMTDSSENGAWDLFVSNYTVVDGNPTRYRYPQTSTFSHHLIQPHRFNNLSHYGSNAKRHVHLQYDGPHLRPPASGRRHCPNPCLVGQSTRRAFGQPLPRPKRRRGTLRQCLRRPCSQRLDVASVLHPLYRYRGRRCP